MRQKPKTFNGLFVRIAALLFHAVLNIIIISWLTDQDISGSWLRFASAVLLLLFLLYLFLLHLVSFIHLFKQRQP